MIFHSTINMKHTKEQLLIEVTRLRDSHGSWVISDEHRRKEFAKAFDWYEVKNSSYGYSDNKKEYRTPTWEEIWIKIGKLLANQKALNYVQDVESLISQVRELSLDFKNFKLNVK